MIRYRLYFDKDKEIEWLDQMAAEGNAMDGFFAGFYHFSPCEKGEWQYQEDIGHGFCVTDPSYKEFMNEMGVEVVTHWGPWVILRRKKQEGEFNLYTDVDGQIAQYRKILLMFKALLIVEILCLFVELWGAAHGIATGWVFTFIIGAIVIVFFNMIVRTRRTINMLLERKGEAPTERNGRAISPILCAGMLLNAVCQLGKDSMPEALFMVLAIAAILMMLSGITLTVALRR